MKRRSIILLLILAVSFFLPALLKGEGFLYGDNITQRIPSLTFFKQEVLHGKVPLWNPFILGGIPFFADLSNNVLAPTNILYLLIPVPEALTILAVFYVSLASVFTYLFMFSLTKSNISSLFSAVVFGFSGSAMAAVNDINSLQGIAFIPVVFYFADNWSNNNIFKNAIFLITALALQFFSSHPQYTYYTWLIVVPYLIYFSKDKKKVAIVKTTAVFTLMLMIISIQLFPFLELSTSVYRPQTKKFSTENQLQLIEFPRLILANFFGSWKKGTSWGPGSQLETGLANTEGYVGIFPLILALSALITVKSKQKRFWTAIVVASFLLSLGDHTPAFEFVRKLLPLFSKFRSPIRILSLYSFAIAILAGMGISKFETRKKT